jgi:hypothetical protein
LSESSIEKASKALTAQLVIALSSARRSPSAAALVNFDTGEKDLGASAIRNP